MYQTSYTGIVPLQRNVTYNGGFCKFWYIPVEDVIVFPRINPANQQLVGEPSLKAGKSWFGPIKVPRDKLGYTEELKRAKAGHYYETKISGVNVGDSQDAHINLENMPYHKYLVVGKVRAGGFYKIIGTPNSPLTFNPAFASGNGPADTARTEYQFVTESIHKALILPDFFSDTTEPGTGGETEEDEIMANHKEIITFEEESSVSIPWTSQRLAKFGVFPVIDVYIQEEGEVPIRVVGGSIEADQPPPSFTELSVKLGGNPSGFIVIT